MTKTGLMSKFDVVEMHRIQCLINTDVTVMKCSLVVESQLEDNIGRLFFIFLRCADINGAVSSQ